MKIAKKMLAVVVAIVMVASLSAMAFAAGTPTLKLVPGEVKDGQVKVAIVAVNGEGEGTFEGAIKFPTDKLEILSEVDAESGKIAAKLGSGKDLKAAKMSTVNFMVAAGVDGDTISYAAILDKPMGPMVDDEGGEIAIDPNNFELSILTFKVKEGATGAAEITFGDVTAPLKGEGCKIVLTEEPAETTTAAPETTTAAPTTTEKATAAANPNTGDQKTGDTVALVAVAGVVAVAGAAFVISKKRK